MQCDSVTKLLENGRGRELEVASGTLLERRADLRGGSARDLVGAAQEIRCRERRVVAWKVGG